MEKDGTAHITLRSPSFENGKSIHSKFTCDGENINPELLIESVPAETKSLVLIMDDPDIPETAKKTYNIDVWDHWIMFNIPPDTAVIKEGESPEGVSGANTRGGTDYKGPCPPDREHRYFFKIYALDKMLDLPSGSPKANIEKAMDGHIIAEGELIGLYKRI